MMFRMRGTGLAMHYGRQSNPLMLSWIKAEETAKARGMFVSTDTSRKIRLDQLDIAQRERPGAFGRPCTLASRYAVRVVA